MNNKRKGEIAYAILQYKVLLEGLLPESLKYSNNPTEATDKYINDLAKVLGISPNELNEFFNMLGCEALEKHLPRWAKLLLGIRE